MKEILREAMLAMVDIENDALLPRRRITHGTALEIMERSLASTSEVAEESLRQHRAFRDLSDFISMSKRGVSSLACPSNTDLLPVGNPLSTRTHAMTASSERASFARWASADSRITDEDVRTMLAAALSAEPGSTEFEYYSARLSALPYGAMALDPLVASFGGGNSRAARSARARMQRRDRYGRFAWMGGGMAALVKRIGGMIANMSGRLVAQGGSGNGTDDFFDIEMQDGRIARIPASHGEGHKAYLPDPQSPDGFATRPAKVQAGDPVLNEEDLVFVDAPNGFVKDESYTGPGTRYTDDAYAVTRYDAGDPQAPDMGHPELRGFEVARVDNGQVGEPFAQGHSWADMQQEIYKDEPKRDVEEGREPDPIALLSDEEYEKAMLEGRAPSAAPAIKPKRKPKPKVQPTQQTPAPGDEPSPSALPSDSVKPVTIPESAKPVARTDPFADANAKMEFDVPEGAYALDLNKPYVPKGRRREAAEDYTDDPAELAQVYNAGELRNALEEAITPSDDSDATGYGELSFDGGDEKVPAEALAEALRLVGGDPHMDLAKMYDNMGDGSPNADRLDALRGGKPVAEIPEAPLENIGGLRKEDLPAAMQGMTDAEFDDYLMSGNFAPYLQDNEELQFPDGFYDGLNWKRAHIMEKGERQAVGFPEGVRDDPVDLAMKFSEDELKAHLADAVEPSDHPGYSEMTLDDGTPEGFAARIPAENIRDALQLQGVDTNEYLRNIAGVENLGDGGVTDGEAGEILAKLEAEPDSDPKIMNRAMDAAQELGYPQGVIDALENGDYDALVAEFGKDGKFDADMEKYRQRKFVKGWWNRDDNDAFKKILDRLNEVAPEGGGTKGTMDKKRIGATRDPNVPAPAPAADLPPRGGANEEAAQAAEKIGVPQEAIDLIRNGGSNEEILNALYMDDNGAYSSELNAFLDRYDTDPENRQKDRWDNFKKLFELVNNRPPASPREPVNIPAAPRNEPDIEDLQRRLDEVDAQIAKADINELGRLNAKRAIILAQPGAERLDQHVTPELVEQAAGDEPFTDAEGNAIDPQDIVNLILGNDVVAPEEAPRPDIVPRHADEWRGPVAASDGTEYYLYTSPQTGGGSIIFARHPDGRIISFGGLIYGADEARKRLDQLTDDIQAGKVDINGNGFNLEVINRDEQSDEQAPESTPSEERAPDIPKDAFGVYVDIDGADGKKYDVYAIANSESGFDIVARDAESGDTAIYEKVESAMDARDRAGALSIALKNGRVDAGDLNWNTSAKELDSGFLDRLDPDNLNHAIAYGPGGKEYDLYVMPSSDPNYAWQARLHGPNADMDPVDIGFYNDQDEARRDIAKWADDIDNGVIDPAQWANPDDLPDAPNLAIPAVDANNGLEYLIDIRPDRDGKWRLHVVDEGGEDHLIGRYDNQVQAENYRDDVAVGMKHGHFPDVDKAIAEAEARQAERDNQDANPAADAAPYAAVERVNNPGNGMDYDLEIADLGDGKYTLLMGRDGEGVVIERFDNPEEAIARRNHIKEIMAGGDFDVEGALDNAREVGRKAAEADAKRPPKPVKTARKARKAISEGADPDAPAFHGNNDTAPPRDIPMLHFLRNGRQRVRRNRGDELGVVRGYLKKYMQGWDKRGFKAPRPDQVLVDRTPDPDIEGDAPVYHDKHGRVVRLGDIVAHRRVGELLNPNFHVGANLVKGRVVGFLSLPKEGRAREYEGYYLVQVLEGDEGKHKGRIYKYRARFEELIEQPDLRDEQKIREANGELTPDEQYQLSLYRVSDGGLYAEYFDAFEKKDARRLSKIEQELRDRSLFNPNDMAEYLDMMADAGIDYLPNDLGYGHGIEGRVLDAMIANERDRRRRKIQGFRRLSMPTVDFSPDDNYDDPENLRRKRVLGLKLPANAPRRDKGGTARGLRPEPVRPAPDARKPDSPIAEWERELLGLPDTPAVEEAPESIDAAEAARRAQEAFDARRAELRKDRKNNDALAQARNLANLGDDFDAFIEQAAKAHELGDLEVRDRVLDKMAVMHEDLRPNNPELARELEKIRNILKIQYMREDHVRLVNRYIDDAVAADNLDVPDTDVRDRMIKAAQAQMAGPGARYEQDNVALQQRLDAIRAKFEQNDIARRVNNPEGRTEAVEDWASKVDAAERAMLDAGNRRGARDLVDVADGVQAGLNDAEDAHKAGDKAGRDASIEDARAAARDLREINPELADAADEHIDRNVARFNRDDNPPAVDLSGDFVVKPGNAHKRLDIPDSPFDGSVEQAAHAFLGLSTSSLEEMMNDKSLIPKGFRVRYLGGGGVGAAHKVTHIASKRQFVIKSDNVSPLGLEAEEDVAILYRALGLPQPKVYRLRAEGDDEDTIIMDFAGVDQGITNVETYGGVVGGNPSITTLNLEDPNDALRFVLANAIIGQTDRHGGNIMFGTTQNGHGSPVFIDNGLAMFNGGHRYGDTGTRANSKKPWKFNPMEILWQANGASKVTWNVNANRRAALQQAKNLSDTELRETLTEWAQRMRDEALARQKEFRNDATAMYVARRAQWVLDNMDDVVASFRNGQWKVP